MELKKYQIKVIDNLNHFLAAFRESATVAAAYQKYWEDQNVPVNNVGGMKHSGRSPARLFQSSDRRGKNISGLQCTPADF